MKRSLLPWLIVAAILLLLFPLVAEKFYLQLVTKIMILAIFALSLDLLVGYTGLVSLGHAAYFGVGRLHATRWHRASDPIRPTSG